MAVSGQEGDGEGEWWKDQRERGRKRERRKGKKTIAGKLGTASQASCCAHIWICKGTRQFALWQLETYIHGISGNALLLRCISICLRFGKCRGSHLWWRWRVEFTDEFSRYGVYFARTHSNPHANSNNINGTKLPRTYSALKMSKQSIDWMDLNCNKYHFTEQCKFSVT